APFQVLACCFEHREVDSHLRPRVGQRLGCRRDVQPRAVETDLIEVDAGVLRVDRGDEVELGIVDDRLADGPAHPPACPEHPDPEQGARGKARPRRGRTPRVGAQPGTAVIAFSSIGPTTASVRGPDEKIRSTTRATSLVVTAATRSTSSSSETTSSRI